MAHRISILFLSHFFILIALAQPLSGQGLPSTRAEVLEETNSPNQALIKRLKHDSVIDNASILNCLITSDFECFSRTLDEVLSGNANLTDEHRQLVQTAIHLYSIQYRYSDILALREQYDLDQYQLEEVNWSEIEFFSRYPTETIHPGSDAVVIPLQWSIAGTPMVEVEIEGRSYNFWLDSGASGSVLSSSVANKIDLIHSDIGNISGTGSTEIEFEIIPALLPKLNVGDMAVRNLPVAIIDSTDLTLAPGVTIDGIVGLPFLFPYDVTFDTENRVIILEKSDDATYREERNFYWLDYPIVQLTLEDGTSSYWGFDSGAGTSRMKSELLAKVDTTGHLTTINMQKSGVGGLTDSFESFMMDTLNLWNKNHRVVFRNIKTTTEEGVSTELIDADGKFGTDAVRNSNGVFFSIRRGVFRFL